MCPTFPTLTSPPPFLAPNRGCKHHPQTQGHLLASQPLPRGLGQLSQGGLAPGGDPRARRWRSLAARPLGEGTQARAP